MYFFLVRVQLRPAPSLDKCAREIGHDTFGGADVYRLPSRIWHRRIKDNLRKRPPYDSVERGHVGGVWSHSGRQWAIVDGQGSNWVALGMESFFIYEHLQSISGSLV